MSQFLAMTPSLPPRSGVQRLDPEVLGAYLGRLLRTASALCDSRESAEDLVQETVARVLSRPRFLRGRDERAYLMQALRNTFLSSTRTAARRPRAVTPLGEIDPKEGDPNSQLVEDYKYWFWNYR